jgi:hypothetical protein
VSCNSAAKPTRTHVDIDTHERASERVRKFVLKRNPTSSHSPSLPHSGTHSQNSLSHTRHKHSLPHSLTTGCCSRVLRSVVSKHRTAVVHHRHQSHTHSLTAPTTATATTTATSAVRHRQQYHHHHYQPQEQHRVAS